MADREPTPNARLDALRVRFGARAAGWWRPSGDRLELVAFSAAVDMPVEVSEGFARATLSVPLVRVDLGIARAAASGGPVISRACELPADSGSGLWLRRFGATRSVAVPVRDDSGEVARVVSLALDALTPDDAAVASAIRDEAEGWGGGEESIAADAIQ